MELIEWSERFSVGVDILDQQHKHLIGLINILARQTSGDLDTKVVVQVLKKMQKYARVHFETEERYLARNDYVDLEEHQKKHREFEKKTDIFIRAIELPVDDVPHTVFIFLRYWWMEHILVEDMKYKFLLDDATG